MHTWLETLYGRLPLQTFMRCCGAGRKPLEYIGEWPKRGRVYRCEVFTDERGEQYVRVVGLTANKPFDCFKAWRFRLVAEAWLN